MIKIITLIAEFGNIALPLILGILVGLLIGAFCVYLIPVFNFKKAQKRAAATTKEAERKADNIVKNAQLDVYRGKTTLEITYRDSVAVDSTVVYKMEDYEKI